MSYKIAVFARDGRAFKNFEKSQTYGIACYWIRNQDDLRAREFNLVAILPDTNPETLDKEALHWAMLRTKEFKP